MTQNYLKQIQKEFSHIKKHGEDDLEWWNEGLDLIEQGKFAEAEKKFKMLIVPQPQHSDGFEGLSNVYRKMKRITEAKYFIDLAVAKAKQSVQSRETDPEILEIVNIFVVTKLKRNYDLSDKENIFPEDKDIPKVKVCLCNRVQNWIISNARLWQVNMNFSFDV